MGAEWGQMVDGICFLGSTSSSQAFFLSGGNTTWCTPKDGFV